MTAFFGIAIDLSPDFGKSGEWDGADFLGLLIWPFILAGVAFILGAILIIGMALVESTPPKVCPECAERVKGEANLCKHCGHRFSEGRLPEGLWRCQDCGWRYDRLDDAVAHVRKRHDEREPMRHLEDLT